MIGLAIKSGSAVVRHVGVPPAQRAAKMAALLRFVAASMVTSVLAHWVTVKRVRSGDGGETLAKRCDDPMVERGLLSDGHAAEGVAHHVDVGGDLGV
jgi:hypothetical protein